MLKMYVTLQTLFIAGVDRVKDGNEKGATAVEYGLMVALIALAIIGVVTGLGSKLKDLFTAITTGIPTA